MVHTQEASSVPETDLAPTDTAGFVLGEQKSLAEYANIDAADESLNKWKASLGLGAGGAELEGPRVVVLSLSLHAEGRAAGPIILDLSSPEAVAAFKKNPVTIKEGSEYAVELKFRINGLVTGVKYIQVVRRAGINVDKLETMVGSYGPTADPILKRFPSEEAPSGMLARSGSYAVRSRVIDDDKNVWIDFEWVFKLGKEW